MYGRQGRHLGEGGQGRAFAPLILKNSIFCVFERKFCSFHMLPPPLRKSVKMLPPLEKN